MSFVVAILVVERATLTAAALLWEVSASLERWNARSRLRIGCGGLQTTCDKGDSGILSQACGEKAAREKGHSVHEAYPLIVATSAVRHSSLRQASELVAGRGEAGSAGCWSDRSEVDGDCSDGGRWTQSQPQFGAANVVLDRMRTGILGQAARGADRSDLQPQVGRPDRERVMLTPSSCGGGPRASSASAEQPRVEGEGHADPGQGGQQQPQEPDLHTTEPGERSRGLRWRRVGLPRSCGEQGGTASNRKPAGYPRCA